LRRLRLSRPLVVFDLEDRIVEISTLRLAPDGTRETRTRRINPERPIPPGATAVHGIRDEDVRDAPTFRQVARSFVSFLEGADLAGFNVLRFDLPLLDREVRDCGLDLGLSARRVVDAMVIFHRKEPRDLSAAVSFFLGREHTGAHSAEADVVATADLLDAQVARYPDLPDSVDELDAWIRPVPPGAVDRQGKFVWRDGEIVFAFGRYEGRSLRRVATETPDYLQWIVGSDFPDDARALVSDALRGEFPEPEDEDGSRHGTGA
jgi:DNA polymerase-3 subunit epsilon